MNLDNVTAELRPRTEWEAADFGVRMIRRDVTAIYKIWFAITLPLFMLTLTAVLYSPFPTLAVILYWWLEPLADGPILRVISRRLFGESADVGASLRQTLTLAVRNRIFLISPYRFHFARSIAMPVTQLEGLSGQERRTRAKILNLKIFNHGTGVTVAYQHLLLAITFGVVLMGYAFVPAEYQDSAGDSWMSLFWDPTSRYSAVANLATFYIAQSALQPWFVGAGFGLYINCRTQLEAWDVEVAFRRMVQRRAGMTATALVLVALPLTLLSPSGWAQQTEDTVDEHVNEDPGIAGYWDDADVRPALRSVLADERLETSRTIEEWRSINQDDAEPEPRNDTNLGWWNTFVNGLVKILSLLVEFGLWIAAALTLLLIVLNRHRWLPYLQNAHIDRARRQRVEIAGGVIAADSLPDDLPGEVRRLWRKGRKRDALSLLYRGSVFAAVANHGIRLPRSATEGQCLRAVSDQDEPRRANYFRRIVSAWSHCAYGHVDPNNDSIDPLIDEWRIHYGAVE